MNINEFCHFGCYLNSRKMFTQTRKVHSKKCLFQISHKCHIYPKLQFYYTQTFIAYTTNRTQKNQNSLKHLISKNCLLFSLSNLISNALLQFSERNPQIIKIIQLKSIPKPYYNEPRKNETT